MPPSELRKEAREALRGKWGKGICIILAYLLITYALSVIGELVNYLSTFVAAFFEGFMKAGTISYIILNIAYNIIVTVPISFGLTISFMKLKRNENITAFGFLNDGFTNFSKSLGIAWHTFVRMLLPVVAIFVIAILMSILTITSAKTPLFALAGVVLYIATLIYTVSRSLLYVVAYPIGYDNPELSSKDCVKKSEELMKGNRGNYFLLELSFIGWAILGILTLCIGYLWLIPYMQVAMVCFYDRILSK